MWRITFPYVGKAIRRRKLSVLIVIGGGFLAGTIATVKSIIESRIIQLVADAMNNDQSANVWNAPLAGVDVFGDDFTSRLASMLMYPLTFTSGILLYVVISVASAAIVIATAASRENVSRTLFTALHRDGLDSSFIGGTANNVERDEPGGLAGAIQQGALSVSNAYGFMIEAGQYFFGLVTVVLLLTNVSVIFALFCLALTCVFALLSWLQGRHLNRRREEYDVQRRALFASTDDVISNRDVLLAHERKSVYLDRLQNSTFEFATLDRDLTVRERFYSGTVGIFQDFGRIAILGIVLLAAAGGTQVERVGDAYFYVAIFARLMGPILGLLSGYDQVRRSVSSSRTLIDLLKRMRGSTGFAEYGKRQPVETAQAATFDRVNFGYTAGKSILRDCTFSIPRGGMTLIVGRSGCGKTTIARMLLGFLKPQSGRVEVFGHSVDDWNHDALLAQMSYLAQTGHVLDGSVHENLFAHETADGTDLINALIDAGLAVSDAEAIGLLAEDAHKLSVGQQQRLALARIFVDRAPFIVLDEPLAGVDAFTFREVRQKLSAWLADTQHTVVVISHRLAFASDADHVVVLGSDGKVSEEGAPRSLEERDGGDYRSLLETARAELPDRPVDVAGI